MHGPLHEISLIEVLQLLERGRRSGTLRLTGDDAATPRTVLLHRGLLASVEPDAGDAALHRALVRRHQLAADEPAGSVAAGPREALRLGLAHAALESMMHWTRGRFDFTEGDTQQGPLAISPEALVMTLVRDESRRAELGGELHDWHGIPALASPGRIAEGGLLLLDPLDWRVLDATDGVRSVAELGALLGEPLEDVGESVLGLQAAAILQVLPPPADAARDAPGGESDRHFDDEVVRLRARVRAAPHDGEAWRALGLAEVGAGRFYRAVVAWESWRSTSPTRAAEADALIIAARTMMEALQETGEQ